MTTILGSAAGIPQICSYTQSRNTNLLRLDHPRAKVFSSLHQYLPLPEQHSEFHYDTSATQRAVWCCTKTVVPGIPPTTGEKKQYFDISRSSVSIHVNNVNMFE